jgi:hypothetical protein
VNERAHNIDTPVDKERGATSHPASNLEADYDWFSASAFSDIDSSAFENALKARQEDFDRILIATTVGPSLVFPSYAPEVHLDHHANHAGLLSDFELSPGFWHRKAIGEAVAARYQHPTPENAQAVELEHAKARREQYVVCSLAALNFIAIVIYGAVQQRKGTL